MSHGPNELYQTIRFEMDDGSKVEFIGRAVFFYGETRRMLPGTIKFTEPKALPEGCKWDTLTGEKK